MATFALVHGAWHDGWCWHLLEEPLRARGHDTVAPTLPIDDVAASFVDYADVVVDAVDGDVGPVVVVGHSVAGRWLHLVAARRPVALTVYVCPRLPDRDGEPKAFRPDAVAGDLRDELGRALWSAEGAAWMYARLPPALGVAATARLRPQHFGMVDRDDAPDLRALPTAAIACRDDEFFSLEYERWAARELLGQAPVELEGGHFPMLEQPDDLAAAIEELL
jgi:pimeloyl-ACP methyl ester carboxylesterase